MCVTGSTQCGVQIAPDHPFHGPYHEREYGFPTRAEGKLFDERLVLEIDQALGFRG